MVNQSLKNKKIIISAGASGIGLATAKVCLSRGAYVYLCDIDNKSLNKLNKHSLINKRLFKSNCDASDESQVLDLFKKIIISAGASGIGLATAKVCLSRGAYVYLCDIDNKSLNKLNKHPLINKRLFKYNCDASDESQVLDLFKKINKKTKKIEKDFISMSSMKKWILEEDIGKMCAFLISDDSSKVSGQVISVDGHTERND